MKIGILKSLKRITNTVDAPSGTALALGEAAARGRGVNLDDVSERGRDGITGARHDGAIGFAVMRGGDAVGEHGVIFYGEADRVEINRALDHGLCPRGNRAAVWASRAKPGLWPTKDARASRAYRHVIRILLILAIAFSVCRKIRLGQFAAMTQ